MTSTNQPTDCKTCCNTFVSFVIGHFRCFPAPTPTHLRHQPTITMQSREASHAGSWYSDSTRTLTHQLDQWLAQVPDTMANVGSLPVPGARVIIAPYVLVSLTSRLRLITTATRVTPILDPVPPTDTKPSISPKRMKPKDPSFLSRDLN
jgi:hypothetical protein